MMNRKIVTVAQCFIVIFTLALVVLLHTKIGLAQITYVNLYLVIYDYNGKHALHENSVLPKVKLLNKESGKALTKTATFNGTHTVCNFLNISQGIYNLKVYWKGVLVYDKDVNLTQTTTLMVYCNVSKVKFKIVDGIGNSLQNITIELSYYATLIQFTNLTSNEEGDVVSLIPFGKYIISNCYMKINGTEVLVKTIGTYTINVNSNGFSLMVGNQLADRVMLDVYPLSFKFLDDDGNVIPGDILKNIRVLVYKTHEDLLIYNASLSTNLNLGEMPSDKYEIKMYWEGYLFYHDNINHYDSSVKIIRLYLNKRIEIQLKSELGEPLSRARVLIICPWNEVINKTADNDGRIILFYVPYGNYTLKIKYKNLPKIQKVLRIDMRDYYTMELKEIVSMFLIVKSLGSKGLPKGLEIKVYFNNSLIKSIILNKSEEVFRTPLGELAKGPLIIHAYWKGIDVGSVGLIITTSQSVTLYCAIYSLCLRILDLDGAVVKNATVVIKNAQFNNFTLTYRTDNEGKVLIDYLPKGYYFISVYWNEFLLGNKTILLNQDLLNERIIVPLKSFMVKVTDVLGQAIPNVKIKIIPYGLSVPSNKLFKLLIREKNTSKGFVIFKQVPLLTNNYEIKVLRDDKVLYSEIIRIDKSTQEIIVKCPVLLIGSFILTQEIGMILIIIAVSICIVVFALKYYFRVKELKSIIAEPKEVVTERAPPREKRFKKVAKRTKIVLPKISLKKLLTNPFIEEHTEEAYESE